MEFQPRNLNKDIQIEIHIKQKDKYTQQKNKLYSEFTLKCHPKSLDKEIQIDT